MKQIKCEMCGSTDLVKQDGVFVCQSCGLKYSIEEVKKMMVEGTVDVSGSTVKVDTSERLKNLYALARRAKEDNNAVDAARYYNEIRVEDPNSWEAAFYAVYYSAMDIRIAQIASAARSVTNCLDSVMELIKNNVPADEQKDCYIDVTNRCILLGGLFLENTWDVFKDACKRYTYSDNMPDSIHDEMEARQEASVVVMATAALALERYFGDVVTAKLAMNRIIEICKESRVGFILMGTLDDLNRDLDKKAEELKEKRKEEYWLAHKDEKDELERRLSQIRDAIKPLIEQRDALNKQKNNLNNRKNEKVSSEKELQSVTSKIDSLKREFSTLGIFSGRRKKEIQAELESLNADKSRLEKIVAEQRAQLQREIQAEIKRIDEQLSPIKAQIEPLKAEEKTIVDELNKDR